MTQTTEDQAWNALLQKIHELKDLDGVLGLLSWDEETYAPAKGRSARGGHTATIEAIKHQRLCASELGDLIERCRPELSGERATMVDRLVRERDRALKVPEDLVKALAQARSEALVAWQDAREKSEYERFAPSLEKILNLTRARADALGATEPSARYDVLLDEYEPNMTCAQLSPVLQSLKDGLVPLVEAIAKKSAPDRSFLVEGRFEDAQQWEFTLELLRDLGFDFERGRQDRSSHPFTGGCALDDVRVTTRVFEDNLPSAVFSTIHECGHGLYEQGYLAAHARTPLAQAPSMGIHESQSRLWENQVGRSRAFWSHYLPKLKARFPALEPVSLDAFYGAINYVEPSLIRVEADELTYNLHILVRYELELALIDGSLEVGGLPEAWNQRMKTYLGVTPERDADGCLQDIHWAVGAFGYFPTYSLGNLYSAQLMKAYEVGHPAVWTDVKSGRFAPLLGWLRENIHQKGHLKSAQETVQDAVGAPLKVEPFLDYLRGKFGALYQL